MILDSMQLKARPYVGTLTWYLPRLQWICKCCVNIACFATALVYTQVPGGTVAFLLLLLCLPASANFYIVVS